jgi:stearoyl-CoA desaturase (delta-9 desaturase)
MFFLVSAYHRYFAHRSFSTSRGFQLVLGVLGASSGEQGPLWWAWVHRQHHRFSDQPEDFHSPTQREFLWSHVGWIFSPRARTADYAAIADLSVYPELRWLDRYWVIPFAALGLICLAVGGVHGLVWGYFVSTFVLWQATFCINSVAHVFGRRRFPTHDTSRNSLTLALLTLGEGWHNNHHYHPGSMWQGFYWWQIDLAAYGLTALSWLGLVWDIHRPPLRVLETGRQWRTNPKLAAQAVRNTA